MVLAEIDVDNIYVVCGYTDMRKSINGLTAIIVQQYQMRPSDRCLFLFCGRQADWFKALLWEGDGFLLLYKVLINFRYHWPRNAREVKAITQPQYQRLLEGLEIEWKTSNLPKYRGFHICLYIQQPQAFLLQFLLEIHSWRSEWNYVKIYHCQCI